MKLCVVSDEVSPDPETAFEIIRSWGIDYVELRTVGDDRYPRVSDYWHERLPRLLEEFDLKVAAVSPGLFLSPFPATLPPIHSNRWADVAAVKARSENEAALRRDLRDLLPQSIEAARRLGVRSIVCFNFARMDHGPSPAAGDDIISVLREAAELVGAAGMQLLIQISEPTPRPVDIVRRVNHPALGINWDPVAAFMGGEDHPYPDGFALARPYIRHVHFKDARINPQNGEREYVAHGVVNWREMLRDLAADGYDGFVSVETHFRPKVAGTRSCVERLKSLIDEVRSATSAN